MKRPLSLLAALGLLACAPTTAAGPPRDAWTFNARPLRPLDVRQPDQARQLWDTWHALAALQGIVNRDQPRLYTFYTEGFGVETDVFWWDWYRGEDGWLRDTKVHELSGLRQAVETFRDRVRGLVVYDPAVPATSNLASTAAGCEDLLPVRYDPAAGSVYRLLRDELQLPVKLWLVNPDGTSRFTGRGTIPDHTTPSTGSAKNDAYLWAIDHFLKNGRCRPGVAAYYIDAAWMRNAGNAGADLHTLPNHDWFIAERAFFFDLSCWGDEPASDDPAQPLGLDLRTLLAVLRALYDRADGGLTRLGGFTPWPFKYTDHGGVGGKHGGVPTEWELSRIVSQYNVYVEADAAGLSTEANASFHRHYPVPRRVRQPNAAPGPKDWKARGWLEPSGQVAPRFYVGHYVGDYDAPSWLAKAVPRFFRDPALGKVPLGWAFNPNLDARAPQALVYSRRHASSNDWFIAGDSGAGYVNPRALTVRPDSGLKPALALWADHCRQLYRRWDLQITGFVLDGSAGASTVDEFRAYATFSPAGLGTHFDPGPAVQAGVGTCPERDLPDDPAAAAAAIAERAQKAAGKPGFLWARSILKPPAWYAEVADRVARLPEGATVTFVDPYSFFGLIRQDQTR